MKITELFPDLSELQRTNFNGVYCKKPTLMIAMTPRTGSTHLCAALATAVDVGEPAEIFNPRGVVQYEKSRRQISLFSEYIASFSNQNGEFFSFKTSWSDFEPFSHVYRRIFPNLKIIYLDRLDVVAQAVSLFRATVSGRWHKDLRKPEKDTTADERLADKFDLVMICNTIEQIELEKRNWELFFFSEFTNPARINYENFESNVGTAVEFIAKHLNLSITAPLDSGTGFQKLADSINDEWCRKVRFYRSGRFYLEHHRKKLVSDAGA